LLSFSNFSALFCLQNSQKTVCKSSEKDAEWSTVDTIKRLAFTESYDLFAGKLLKRILLTNFAKFQTVFWSQNQKINSVGPGNDRHR